MVQNPLGLVLPYVEFRATNITGAAVSRGDILNVHIDAAVTAGLSPFQQVDYPASGVIDAGDDASALYVVALEDAAIGAELQVCAKSGGVQVLVDATCASVAAGGVGNGLIPVGTSTNKGMIQAKDGTAGTSFKVIAKILEEFTTGNPALKMAAFDGINGFGPALS